MSDLKASSFKNVPKQMYDNANSSQNTQIGGKISESKPLTTPTKSLAAEIAKKQTELNMNKIANK